MIIYYVIFFLAFLLCALDYAKHELFRRIVYIGFCTFLIVLPGVRTIGTDNDSKNYEEIYNISNGHSLGEIVTGNYDDNTERGYALLNKIIGLLGGNIHVLLFVVALATGVLNYTIIYKLCPFPFTALIFYLCFYYFYRDFTQIRYGLSCAVVFWSVYFLLKEQYFYSFLTAIGATLFHSTAFAVFLVLPFCLIVKNRYFYFILPFVGLIGLFKNPFPILLSLGGVPEHMQIYLNAEGGGGLVVTGIGLIIMCLYLVYHKHMQKNEFNFPVYYRLTSMGAALNVLFIQASIFQRFSYLFFQFSIILFPNIVASLLKLKDRYYFVALHFLVNCFFLYYGIKLIAPTLIRPYFN